MYETQLEKFLPYDLPRPGQIEIANKVYHALVRKNHLVIQAPTGFGKTASLLAASLLAVEREGISVYYAVRTHREAEVAIRELKRIERRTPFPFAVVEMRGRTHLCAMNRLAGINAEVASRLCHALVANSGCEFFNRMGKKYSTEENVKRPGIWDFAWAIATGSVERTCPYFILKSKLIAADIVVSPYQYVVFEPLRRYFVRNERRPKGLIIDECVTGDTLVKTSNGEVAAEEIQDESTLLSTLVGTDQNPRTTSNRILRRTTYLANALLKIRTEQGNDVEVTRDTRVLGLRGNAAHWFRASDLKPGDTVWSEDHGDMKPTVVRYTSRVQARPVYDFIMIPHHNYIGNGLIVHNSHNLPALLGALGSRRLRVIDIEEALLEALFLGSPLSKFVERLLRTLKAARTGAPTVIGKRPFLEGLEEASGGVDPFVIAEITRALSEKLQGKIVSQGGLHEGALVRLSSFLRSVVQMPPDGLLQYVARGHFPDDYLELSWWDASLGRRVFRHFQSTIHASGTNDWADAYAALIGLPKRYSVATADFPLGPENCFVGILDNVTTQEESRTDENYERYSHILAGLANSLQGRSALFATSFEVLNGLRLAGFGSMLLPRSYWESEDMDSYQHEAMLKEFSSRQGEAIIVGVIGGRSGEGVDFGPGGLNNSVVFGVPFPEPSPLMQRYAEWLEGRFGGKGRDYAYVYPAVVKAAQALGRAPRSPEDRVVCILADKRFSETRLLSRFPKWIRENSRGVYASHVGLAEDIERFYSAGHYSS